MKWFNVLNKVLNRMRKNTFVKTPKSGIQQEIIKKIGYIDDICKSIKWKK